MNRFKNYFISVLIVCLFLFSACPVIGEFGSDFINNKWINQNGFWLNPMPTEIKNYFSDKDIYKFLLSPIYDKDNSGSPSGVNRGDVYYKYVNGSYQLDWVDNKLNPFDTPQYSTYYTSPLILELSIINNYSKATKSYSGEIGKQNLINACNKYGLKYEENNSTSLYIYYPIFQIYFTSYSNPGIYNSANSGYIKNKSYEGLTYYNASLYNYSYENGGTRRAGYEYKVALDLENNLTYSATPIYTTSVKYYTGYVLLNPNGLMYKRATYNGASPDISFANNWELSLPYKYNDRNGLYIDITLAIFPGTKSHKDSTNYKEMISLANTRLLGCNDASCKVNFLDGLYPVYDIGMYNLIDKFFKGEQVPLPVAISNIIYNRHTYYNNRNNYYWWSTLNYNPDDSSGDIQEPDNSTPDNPSGGGSGDGGSGEGGSGGDTNITIDTENIENLLQQILEALQNQGTTEVDLSEIENLLNAIKNNLKDYTGDLTTINNTLTLINQFLNNNVDVPLSDLKTLLNDIKTLSEYQKEQLTGISAVLHDMKQLFIDIYNRLGEIKDKIGGTINNIEEGTNLWDVLKALIDNLGNFLSSGLELFEKLLVPQGTFETDFNSTITAIQDKLGVLYQPVDVFSNFLTNLYAPTETSTLADSGHIITIPEAKYDGVTIIEAQSINLDETVESSGLKPLYDVYLLIVDMIVLFGILNLAFKKFHDIISENGGDYK